MLFRSAQIVSDVLPGFESGASWNGVGGPANLPRPIVLRQVAAIHKALNQKDLQERFNKEGAFTNPNGPEEFAARIASDLANSRAIVKAANIALLE